MGSPVRDGSALSTGEEGQDPAARAVPRLVRQVSRSPTAEVPIRSLRLADSPRLVRKSEEHVRLLAGTDAALPPILVHRETMRVIDGTHRLLAARLRGEETIEVRFFEGDAKDAFVLAVKANIAHGLPLSVAERTAAARRILRTHPHWSDRVVAETVGLTAKTVASVRRRSTEEHPQSKSRLGKDGRVRPLDGAAGRLRAHELLRGSPGVPLRVIAQQAGISISTAWDVRARVQRGEDPVPPRQRKAMTATARNGPKAGLAPDDGNDAAAATGRNRPGPRQGPPPPRNVTDTLQRLRKDPSLRFNAAGRDFLRWFESRLISPHEWSQFIDSLPPHQAALIVEIARKNAELWREFAEQLRARRVPVEGRSDGG